jgi:hypothetical protein
MVEEGLTLTGGSGRRKTHEKKKETKQKSTGHRHWHTTLVEAQKVAILFLELILAGHRHPAPPRWCRRELLVLIRDHRSFPRIY